MLVGLSPPPLQRKALPLMRIRLRAASRLSVTGDAVSHRVCTSRIDLDAAVVTSHWSKAHAGLTMPQKLLEAIAVSDMEVAGVTSLGTSLSKNTRKRDGKRKTAAAAEASAAKQARVAEKDAASQAALSGRGQRSARN